MCYIRKETSPKPPAPHWCGAGLKRRLVQLFVLGLGVVASAPENALAQAIPAYTRQPAMVDFDQTVGMPSYIFRAYQFAADTPGQVRVEVYIGMVNDILQFVKASPGAGEEGGHTAAGYRAQYEMNVTIWDKKNNVVDGRNWKRELVVNSFDATNDRKKLNLERAVFDLPQGEYEIALEITDRDTGKNLRERRPLKLAPLDDEQLHFSSIVFTEPHSAGTAPAAASSSPSGTAALALREKSSRTALRDSLRYNLTAILANQAHARKVALGGVSATSAGSQSVDASSANAAGAYFEIYGATPGESLRLQYEIRDWRQQVEQSWEETIAVTQTPISHLVSLAEKIAQPGLHTLRLVAKSAAPGKREATAEESFQVQVSATPNYTAQLVENKAMLYEPLRYIVKSADYKRFAEAAEATRDSMVADFWRQRDPDPETSDNQLREEFYRRVAFADMRFVAAGSGKSGWETDRGRIYIKYGPPKEVHHQMAEQGSPPYEIWFYPDLDLYFVFRDKTGSGDFELVNR
jgi:GWxTD domain-containing protein